MLYLHLYIILLTYLGNNQLTGYVPSSVGQLIHLMVLSFWENQINGSIPEKLGNLKNLTGLDLSENFISGRIPSQFQYTLRMDFSISTRHKWFHNQTITHHCCFFIHSLGFSFIFGRRKRIAYEDIVKATEDFDIKYYICVGGYCSVYRAGLPSGKTVALKKLPRWESNDPT